MTTSGYTLPGYIISATLFMSNVYDTVGQSTSSELQVSTRIFLKIEHRDYHFCDAHHFLYLSDTIVVDVQ